jgi:hypothetical protein
MGLPPSVSVHAGSWRLIGIFHGGDNGGHDYRLYNLDDDIGETQNLAAEFPERVKTLDAMIENHLQETQAVTCPVAHDGAWHDYEVAIPGTTLDGLRFDAATGKGRVEFDWTRLESQDGTVLKEWGF